MEWHIDTIRPVAVIAGGPLSALGVVRCLARHNIRCWLLAWDPQNLAIRTRHATPRLLASLDADSIAAELRHIAERAGSAPVILPTEDHIVRCLSENREVLGGDLPDLLPSPAVLAALMRKATIGDAFARAGIAYSRTLVLDTDAYPERLDDLRYPVILKPDTKPADYLSRFRKAYILSSEAEVRERITSMRGMVETVILQEYIQGPDTEIFFCLALVGRDGRLVQSFVGRKLASWPVGSGNTAACIPAPPDIAEEIRGLSERFFRANGFFGIGSVEFKRAPTGEIFGIEPTVCRVNAQSEIAVLNGVELPLAFYAFATGQEPPPPRAVDPAGWVDPFLRAFLVRTQGWRPPRSGIPPLQDALWRWTDPGPTLAYYGRHLRRAPHALAHRLVGRVAHQ
ncbi:MAG: hypothetical protein Tsb008_16620 [Rhodothalassiaceae bacterium]